MTKKILPLCLAAFALMAGFSTSAKAHSPRKDCRQVVQVISFGGILRLSEYGTACERRGDWLMVSEHPHPRRYGKDLYYWNHGQLVSFRNDNHHHDNRRHKRHKNRHHH